MDPGLVIGLYLGCGLAVTSALHTWYVDEIDARVSFGVPSSSRFRRWGDPREGYVGSVIVGFVALLAVYAYFLVAPPPQSLGIDDLLQAKLPELVVGAGLLAGLSQVAGGSSWSKAILDAALCFMAGILLVSFVQPPSFWNLFTVYATIVPTLGGAWAVWRDYYVATRIADGEDGDSAAAVLYPHFPSFAYFAGSAAYTLVVSLFLLVQNVE